MSRDAALARYQELPVPDTTQEAWRFTNLRGFDPNTYTAEPDESMFQTESMLPELEVSGWAEVSETGLRIHSVPAVEGVRFELLDENDPRLHTLVGWNEKFPAHNAALWKHGLLVHVPKGVELGHEATVSKIGEEQLFYLMSRGLSEAEASALIVSGFVEPITKELPLEYAVEMNRLIQLQMEGSVG